MTERVSWPRYAAVTVTGARRILAACERNRDYAIRANLPAWLQQVTRERVEDAAARLAELERRP